MALCLVCKVSTNAFGHYDVLRHRVMGIEIYKDTQFPGLEKYIYFLILTKLLQYRLVTPIPL